MDTRPGPDGTVLKVTVLPTARWEHLESRLKALDRRVLIPPTLTLLLAAELGSILL